MKRDEEFYEKVSKFIKDNLEKGYHFSFAKLTSK